jgi:alginate O-acetyltransferase complex protein AlgI
LKKNFFYFLTGFLFTVFVFSALQEFYLTNPIFPKFENLLPDFILSIVKKPVEMQSVEHSSTFQSSSEIGAFFQTLSKLEKSKAGIVKILHFGDSLIWGDILTERIKTNFHRDFGFGGIGLVPIAEYRERYFKNYKNFNQIDSFQKFHLNHRQNPNPFLGFLGEGFIPKQKEFQLSYQADSSKINFYFDVQNSDSFVVINNQIISNSENFHSIQNKNIPISFHISEAEKFSLHGVSLENESGIVYSSVPRQGIELTDLQIIGDKFSSIKNYSPDLIILQFGINESENIYTNNYLSSVKYKTDLENTIRFIKFHSSKSQILLIAPMERVYADSKPMKEISEIIAIQKSVSLSENISFLNLYSLLGGANQNEKLYNEKILQSDRTHLTRSGGDIIGDLIYFEIQKEYRNFLGEEIKMTLNETKKKMNNPILFSSKAFFYFFIFVFILIFSLPKYKILILSLSSVYFYAAWDLSTIPLLLFSTFIGFYTGIKIDTSRRLGQKIWLLTSILFNLIILFYFKYFIFFQKILNEIYFYLKGEKLFSLNMQIFLPIGISFYTFQILSYSIDVFRKQVEPEKKFLSFLHYIAFFPQLIAGPIVRAQDFLAKRKNDSHYRTRYVHFSNGVFLFIVGLLKKLLADNLANSCIDKVFSNPEMFSSLEILLSIYAYAAQIYLDFSGYSDMAIGLAKILGYRLTLNFLFPYSSFTITEFWRRWHISLSNWFRDYLYIPLGGNRKNIYFNLFLVMILCGLWHGASFLFLLWGLWHGLFLLIERFFLIRESKSYIRKFFTLHIIIIGWILFRSGNLETYFSIWNRLFKLETQFVNQEVWVIAFLILFFIYQFFRNSIMLKIRILWQQFWPFVHGISLAFCIFSIYYFTKISVKPFIYFEF